MTRWLALAALLAGCSPGSATVSLTFEQLVPIAPEHGHYEAWAELDDGPVSLGKFRPDAQGRPLGLDGAPLPPATVAGRLRALRITQELPGDTDAVPSRQAFLHGIVKGDTVRLAAPLDPAAYARESGVYLLDNPVTYRDPGDMNGIWFAKLLMRRYEPGLSLGPAPDGWLYAGWVLLDGHTLRTGKFRSGSDNDDWAGYSGRTGATELINPAGKPMPGEDFIADLPPGLPTGRDLPKLGGATVLVTLESATLANSERHPGPLRLFQARIPDSPVHLRRYVLENVAATQIPSGVARLVR